MTGEGAHLAAEDAASRARVFDPGERMGTVEKLRNRPRVRRVVARLVDVDALLLRRSLAL